ncbi:MAG: glycosyltransferase [Armatimonadetes bacterium]|nr:glycosyltransferase [Armatimonadota bacterium]
MKVAIVNDWIANMGGAERVLLAVHDIFPDAPVYCTLVKEGNLSPEMRELDIRTSFLQKIPFSGKLYQRCLPLAPLALEQFDLTEYEVVLSMNFSCAKGVITRPDTTHICFCHTPMRYAWDMFHEYRDKEKLSSLSRVLMAPMMNYLRVWDYASAARVDYFVANSSAVARRIHKYYRRDCTIIPPPVQADFFTPNGVTRFEYYLYVSRLVRYKRADLAVEAFNQLGLPLVVVGDGPERKRLEAAAAPNIRFAGRVSEEALREMYRGCKALIFPQEEDFGIVPLEAQACGRPVIAYGVGGALDTVVPGATGVFFTEQSAESLVSAVRRFRDCDFDSSRIRGHACAFDTEAFKNAFRAFVEQKHREHTAGMHSAGKSGAEWHGANGGSAGAGRGSADRPEEEKLLVPGD